MFQQRFLVDGGSKEEDAELSPPQPHPRDCVSTPLGVYLKGICSLIN
jgi:hypothetical protein